MNFRKTFKPLSKLATSIFLQQKNISQKLLKSYSYHEMNTLKRLKPVEQKIFAFAIRPQVIFSRNVNHKDSPLACQQQFNFSSKVSSVLLTVLCQRIFNILHDEA